MSDTPDQLERGKHNRKLHLRTLERRHGWLSRRIAEIGNPQTTSFDSSEKNALEWAIALIKKDLQDRPPQ